MKIAVVGATGNLGKRIVRQALEAGAEVRGFVRSAERAAEVPELSGTELVERDLFALGAADLEGCDALVSAFGSGFSADPSVNEKACEAYIELGLASGARIVAVVGSGCLFTDDTRSQRVCEAPGHPGKLKAISEAATRGLAHMDESTDIAWTLVTPALKFDGDGAKHAAEELVLDVSRTVPKNASGESYSTYEDVAQVMLAVALGNEGDSFDHELVCVVSPS